MPDINIYLRQSNITYSRGFLDTMRRNNIVCTHRNRFGRSGIVLNHGNTSPITCRDRVRRLYVINNPDSIHLCSNKWHNYQLLPDFYPYSTLNWKDVKKFPIIAKPLYGHHGYGIKVLDNWTELCNLVSNSDRRYIFQEKVDILHEYRFNIFDNVIFQISKKEHVGSTQRGGYQFQYVSLGVDARISNKFKEFINELLEDFYNQVGKDIGFYGIDIIKSTDGEYHLCEINTACGLGDYSIEKLKNVINEHYNRGWLENYRVR